MDKGINNGIVILGDDPLGDNSQVEKKVVLENNDPKNEIVVLDNQPKKETKVDDKAVIDDVLDVKPKTIESKEKIEKPIVDEEKETLEFTFDNEKPKPQEKKQQQETVVEVNEANVLEFLNKNGINVKNVSELSKKEVLSEQVKEFQKFNAETNGTIADFYSIQKDWTKESDSSLLKAYYENSDTNLSPEAVQGLIDHITVSEQDEVDLNDRELAGRKNDLVREISKAKSFMSDFQKKHKVSLEKTQVAKPPTAEEIAKSHAPYWKDRNKSLKKLTDIKVSIKGLGDIIIPVSDEDRITVARNTQTVDDFIGRFKGEDGKMNTDRTVRSTLYSDPTFFQNAVISVAKQVHALTLENFSKENRNLTLGKHKQITEINNNDDGMVVTGRKKEGFAPKARF